MSSKTKGAVPDAWDDDWESLADVRDFSSARRSISKHYGSLMPETRIGRSDASASIQAEDL